MQEPEGGRERHKDQRGSSEPTQVTTVPTQDTRTAGSLEPSQVTTVPTQDTRTAGSLEPTQVTNVTTQDTRTAGSLEPTQVTNVTTQDTRTAAACFLSLVSPSEQTVYTSVGKNLTLRCSFHGNCNFDCSWQGPDKQKIANSSRLPLRRNMTIPSELRIYSISCQQFGDYFCRAWISHTTVEGVIHVHDEAASFLSLVSPSEQTVYTSVGRDLTYKVPSMETLTVTTPGYGRAHRFPMKADA
ncbi:uncharacterized protein [Mobula birostris]|uniref:uncharacterized protein n=1 Tax=Mobula birostris TaxID=1983395 RepID=UPI003B285D38